MEHELVNHDSADRLASLRPTEARRRLDRRRSGGSSRLHIARFGGNLVDKVAIPGGDDAGLVFAARFASGNLLYLGTTTGQVFKVVLRTGGVWDLARIDNAPAGALGVTGLINDVAIDWADLTGSSIYVAFGGSGDGRHVWWFDGARWQARSGAAASALLDVEHNAMAVDRQRRTTFTSRRILEFGIHPIGENLNPHGNGLPEAPVFDLQIHPTQRLPRAALHGRGVFEYSIG